MVRLARVLIVALIVVFAAWSVVQVANATTMSLEMAAMTADEDGAMDRAACDACGSDQMVQDASLSCSIACTSPAVVDLADSEISSLVQMSSEAPMAAGSLVGQTYPPDPFPPRSVLI